MRVFSALPVVEQWDEQSVGRGVADRVVPEVNVDWRRPGQRRRYATETDAATEQYMQKNIHIVRNLITVAVISFVGCNQHSGGPQSTEPTVIAEGTIFTVEYKLEDGKTGGFTRLNTAKAVPGGNGSWNVDAQGRLTNDYLIIAYPQRKGLGPHIIPAHRLVDIKFGDGGIKAVNENEPASGH